MKVQRIGAVFVKQILDTLRNKTILIQFIMFPLMGIVFSMSAENLQLEKSYFVNMFSIMYISMAPIVVIASTVSEDKEKGGFLALRMANVKPIEYIIGIGANVIFICFCGVVLMSFFAGFSTLERIDFIVSCTYGLLVSCGIGSIIGVLSKNQSSASGMSVPAMLAFSFLPMLTQFNPSIHFLTQYIYTQQISDIINSLQKGPSLIILLVNGLVVVAVFIRVSKRAN